MKLKLLVTTLALTLSACASTSAVDEIQRQIDTLKVDVEQVSTDAKSAQSSAADTSALSTRALLAADRAAQLSLEASKKLNRMFTKTMYK